MKKILAIIALIVLASLNVMAIGGAEVKASILRYEPTPAEQGNTVDVWLQLSNAGTKAEKVAIKFVPEFPFSLPQGQTGEIDVGTVAATEDKVLKFTLYVDPAAPNGEQDVTFLYRSGAINQWTQLEAPITVQTQNAALIIDDYAVSPAALTPGRIANVKLTLKNAGRIGIKNLDISLDLDDKFSTVRSGTKKRVDYIAAGEEYEISFQLASDASTQVKLYNIPVNLEYQDDRNKYYADSAKVSLVVNADPELSLTVDQTDFKNKKSAGTVSLKVVNKGVADVKYLTVRLAPSSEYKILSPSTESYVGNLDNDDFEIAEFLIKPLVTQPKLQVALEFKDPYNKDFQQDFTLPLRIITEKDLGTKRSPIGIILLVLIVGGFIYYKYYHKKKKRK